MLGLKTKEKNVTKKKLSLKNILKTKKGKTIFISAIVGVSIILVTQQISQLTGDANLVTLGFIAGIISAVMPLSMLQMTENRRGDSIDKNLPVFLLALVSSVESGASLLRAVEEAAGRKMGSLTPELQNLRANISWGMPHDEVFDNFTKRVKTKLAKRVAVLLQIAMDIGGDISNTLELVQKHVMEMQAIEKERKSALSPYIYTIYIAFVVFLAVAVILTSQFFTEIEVVQQNLIKSAEETNVPLGMFGALLGVDVAELQEIMFHMAIVEAIFGGLAAGKISESSFVAGIKHMVIMIILAVVAFSIIGGGIGG